MLEFPSFDEMIRRVRARDEDAAAVLVKRYEPAIRRAVRFRLADARLGNLLDSTDICQSVLKSFFLRAGSGHYELETPEKLLKLLTAMAHNKLVSQARKQYARRRDGRRPRFGTDPRGRFVAHGESPSVKVAAIDLIQEVRRRLAPIERELLDLRDQGHDWAAMAARLGGTGEALRKRLARALARVSQELGLDDIS